MLRRLNLNEIHTKKNSGLVLDEPLIFERGAPLRSGFSLPSGQEFKIDGAEEIPDHMLRQEIRDFPEVSEPETVRHYTRLSQWNFGVDSGFYPLGSCTMKYNPKINDIVASMPGFMNAHPWQPGEFLQGALEIMYRLSGSLSEICGMDKFTLQPAAGAHGELSGMMMIRAFHTAQGNPRKKVLIPDTAHGTNPASSALCHYDVVVIKSGPDGILEPAEVAKYMDEDVAALMVTNPNTLGLWEKNIVEIAEIVHAKGGFIYWDGANLNALMGIARPGDCGADVIQINLHKTFSTPHGGGGPGSGPVGVKEKLAPFLPVPLVTERAGTYSLDYNRPQSIGKIHSFYGNFGVFIRAYCYILEMGGENLRQASEMAILNANYIREKLKDCYHLPYPGHCMHESVFTDKNLNKSGATTMMVAKRLMDYGFHPPTIYFPLVVHGALMIEPTETESKEVIDSFIDTLKKIAAEAEDQPELLKNAPYVTKLCRLDETTAARKPILRWEKNPPPGK
jgi:glycine dehydrogenase subunit 2